MSLLLARFVVAAGTDSFTITESTAAAAVTGSGQDSFAVTETGDGAVANSGTDTGTFTETGDGAVSSSATDTGTFSEVGTGVVSGSGTDTGAVSETGTGVVSGDSTDSFAVTETGDGAVADAGEDYSAIGVRPFHELVDPFAGSALGPQWTAEGEAPASFSVHDGLLELDRPGSGSATVQTVDWFTLAESSVVVEAVATSGYASLVSDWGFFDLAPRDDTVYGFLESGDDSVDFEFAYDPADRFLRWRESAGTVYAETSPDRSTWTERATVPTPPFLTGGLRFEVGVSSTVLEVYGVNAHLESPQGAVAGDSTDTGTVTETGDGVVTSDGTDNFDITDEQSNYPWRRADTFDTIDLSFWGLANSNMDGDVTIDAGRLKLDSTGGDRAIFGYDLGLDHAPPVDMRFEVEIDPASFYVEWFVADQAGGDFVDIEVYDGDLHVTTRTGDTTIPYDAVAHRWWRLVILEGSVYFYVAPDGSNNADWTLLRSDVNVDPEPYSDASWYWQVKAPSGGGIAWFDNLQIADYIPPATDSLAITGTGDAAVADSGTDSFAVTETGSRRLRLDQLRTPLPPLTPVAGDKYYVEDWQVSINLDPGFTFEAVGDELRVASDGEGFAQVGGNKEPTFNDMSQRFDATDCSFDLHVTQELGQPGFTFALNNKAADFSVVVADDGPGMWLVTGTGGSDSFAASDEFWVRLTDSAGVFTVQWSDDTVTWHEVFAVPTPSGWDDVELVATFLQNSSGPASLSQIVGFNTLTRSDVVTVTETGTRRILLGDLRTPQGDPPWDDWREFYDDDITFSDAPRDELQADSSAAGQFASIDIGYNGNGIDVDGIGQTFVFHVTLSDGTVGGYFVMYSDGGASSFFGTDWSSYTDFEFEDTAAFYTTDEFWVRVVEAAGTLTSETSLDGLTWTLQTSYPTPDGWDRVAIDVTVYDDDVGSSVVGINTPLAADVVLDGTDSFAVTESGVGVVAGDGQDSGAVTDAGDAAVADSGTDTGTASETGTGAVAGSSTDTVTVTETGDGVVSGSGTDSGTAVATGNGAVAGAGDDLVTITDSGDDRVVEPTDVIEEGTDTVTVTETGSHDVVNESPPTAEHAPGRSEATRVPRTPRRPRAPPAGDVVLAGTDVFLISAAGEHSVAGPPAESARVEPPAPPVQPPGRVPDMPAPRAPRSPQPAAGAVLETGTSSFALLMSGVHHVTGPMSDPEPAPAPGRRDDDEAAILALLLAMGSTSSGASR